MTSAVSSVNSQNSTSPTSVAEAVARLVRPIEDWPEPGVTFRDVTPLLGDPDGMAVVVDALADAVRQLGDVAAVVGVEARGFILGAPLARELHLPFVPVRKAGKLPAETLSISYDLEYGSETIEVHADALEAGQRVVVIDDVLATGGTLAATNELIDQCGAVVAANLVMIEISPLGGRERLSGAPLITLHTY